MSKEVASIVAPPINGHILIFYAYDVGDYIDFGRVKQQKLIHATTADPFPHFKNYHIPLNAELPALQNLPGAERLSAKVHSFGALSFCYKIPFSTTFDELKVRLIENIEKFEEIAETDSRFIFNKIKSTINEPVFYDLKSMYYAVHVDNQAFPLSNKNLISQYGSTITSLLRLETQSMSDFQKDEILESATGYYGGDLLIIDGEAAFLYDQEYFEAIEFFELANLQKLELQCFDKLLDKKLNFFYNNHTYSLPWQSYIPLFGNRMDALTLDLARLRVDVAVVAERLNNTINLSGDTYLENLYQMLIDKMKIKAWKQAIDEKLSIISELYNVRKNRLQSIREEILTIIIILLFASELILIVVLR